MLGSQNVSIEIWIETANLNCKLSIHSEDINKMQTEFSQSGIFPQSGMHKVSY